MATTTTEGLGRCRSSQASSHCTLLRPARRGKHATWSASCHASSSTRMDASAECRSSSPCCLVAAKGPRRVAAAYGRPIGHGRDAVVDSDSRGECCKHLPPHHPRRRASPPSLTRGRLNTFLQTGATCGRGHAWPARRCRRVGFASWAETTTSIRSRWRQSGCAAMIDVSLPSPLCAATIC